MARTASELPATAVRLLEGATECFSRHGYQASTTRDISQHAGLSAGALYFHFESKEHVLYQLIASAHERLLDALAEIPPPERGRELETIAAQIRTVTHWHIDNNRLARVAQQELTNLTPEHSETIRGLRNRVESTLRGPVEAGGDAGTFAIPDSRLYVRALLSLAIDVIRWYSPGSRYTPDQLAESNVDILTTYLRAHMR